MSITNLFLETKKVNYTRTFPKINVKRSNKKCSYIVAMFAFKSGVELDSKIVK